MENDDGRVRDLIRQGDAIGATQLVIERYGAEIFGYVTSLLKDEDVASDAFARACENVYKGVLSFRGDSSIRTWLYVVARHAAHREARSQRQHRAARLSGVASALQAPIRTATAAFKRTDVKSEIAKLREALTGEERELLLLRVDRGMSWAEIAAVCAGPEVTDDEALKREAARCRKQFERTKVRLRELAEQAGLLRDSDDS
jgi:RNA polymerase sigma-70 factor (ECF subfamily)